MSDEPSVDSLLSPEATGDLPREGVDEPIIGQNMRAFERRVFDASRVKAKIWMGDTKPANRGHLENASAGGLLVKTDCAAEFPTSDLEVRLTLNDGYAVAFPARAVRQANDEIAIQLIANDASWRFRRTFLEDLEKRTADLPSVEIRNLREATDESYEALRGELSRLGRAWKAVLEDFESEDQHQAFIRACIEAHRVEFAFERYHQLRAARPDDPMVKKHLTQIGHILGFYALRTTVQETIDVVRKKHVAALVFFILVGFVMLIVAREFLADMQKTEDKEQRAETSKLSFD